MVVRIIVYYIIIFFGFVFAAADLALLLEKFLPRLSLVEKGPETVAVVVVGIPVVSLLCVGSYMILVWVMGAVLVVNLALLAYMFSTE